MSGRCDYPAALVVALMLGCTAGEHASDVPTAPAPRPAPLLLGADISALARLEQAGAIYRGGASVAGAIPTLRAGGANIFRLRLFVAPNGDDVQVNDLAYTVALAKRVRASGAQLLLDLHYSDTWADPGNQQPPAAWAALGIDSLETRVESYTKQVMDTLRTAGVVPRIVQIGNEIDAGVRGVRAATTTADSLRVLLHYSGGASASGTKWFFDIVQAQRIDFDLIGLSYYPWWHGTVQQLRDNLSVTALRYGKEIMIVETAYPWRDDWVPSGALPTPWAWPRTAEGQRSFLRDVIAAVDGTPNGHGAGVLWWYPESVRVPGVFIWGGGSLALFDASGALLPAADVFRATNAER